ncbi:5522_t:CDS:2, partial [Funneliformis geosporum]
HLKFSINKKQKIHTSQEDLEQNKTDLTDEINKNIASFKINDDLTFKNSEKWSLDISSMRNYNVGNFIFVAVSCIDVEKDMKKKEKKDKADMKYMINVEVQTKENNYKTPQENIIMNVPDKRTAI